MDTAVVAGRVRVRGGNGSTLSTARAQAERAATAVGAAVGDAIGGLPSGAVLIVRKLRVYAPSAGSPQLPQDVGALWRNASRPIIGAPAPNATAVLFTDEAELLACLTRDVLRGYTGAWYWQQIMPFARRPGSLGVMAASGSELLAAAWIARVSALPAALAQLKPAEAASAARILGPREVSLVVNALHRAFALPTEVLDVQLPEPGEIPSKEPAPPPPWGVLGPPGLREDVTPQAAYLLGLSLTLAYAPALATGTAFAKGAAAWLRVALRIAASPSTPAPPAHLTGLPPTNLVAQTSSEPLVEPAGSTHAARIESAPSLPPAEHTLSARTTPRATQPIASVASGGAARPLPGSSARHVLDATLSEPTAEYLPVAPVAMNERDGQHPATSETGNASRANALAEPPYLSTGATLDIVTGLAGTMFLANLLPRLDLEGLLSPDPSDGGTDESYWMRSGWALIEALAAGLLGRRARQHADDPLWGALGVLDGRTRDPAERSSPAPAAVARRLRRGLLPSIRLRVARMLGVRAADVAPVLLVRQGRVLVTRTHVDVIMPMDGISLPVRRAGLDANPGWRPDLGRIVMFYYE